jgi:hypothetical protein
MWAAVWNVALSAFHSWPPRPTLRKAQGEAWEGPPRDGLMLSLSKHEARVLVLRQAQDEDTGFG